MRRTLIVVCTTLALAGAALAQTPAQTGKEDDGAVYEWVDDQGQSHFTDDRGSIPQRYRAKARKLDTPPNTRIRNDAPATGSRGADVPDRGSPAYTGIDRDEPDGGARDERTEEQKWRDEFQSRRQRIAELEKQIADDRALLQGQALAPRMTPTGFHSQAPEVEQRVARNEQELARLRQELDDVERRAREESVPLEWRRD